MTLRIKPLQNFFNLLYAASWVQQEIVLSWEDTVEKNSALEKKKTSVYRAKGGGLYQKNYLNREHRHLELLEK